MNESVPGSTGAFLPMRGMVDVALQMAPRDEILGWCEQLLDVDSFEDFGPNGLQVPGAEEISKVATGVTANLETLQGGVDSGAQLILCHHGVLWGDQVTPLSVP